MTDVMRWPAEAPSHAERIEKNWSSRWPHTTYFDIFIYAVRNNIPGPDIDEHPDDDSGTELWCGECYCRDCLGDY